jgi:ankyrin repeat protein
MPAVHRAFYLSIVLVAAAPAGLRGEDPPNKVPEFALQYRSILNKLEHRSFDDAREHLRKHPEAIRQGVAAGYRPLAPFVFRPSHPAYHITEQELLTSLDILLEHGASPDETNVLYALLHTGRLKAAALLLKKDPQPDLGGSYLSASLWRGGDSELIAKLLRLEADVNLYDAKLDVVPLQMAVRNKDQASAELLLKHDADVNRADDMGQTALHLALRQPADPAMVSLLLRYAADASLVDKQGIVPMDLAVHHPQAQQVLASLREHGAKLTPAAMIAARQHDELARWVVDEETANHREPVHRMPLIVVAALAGNEPAAARLLKLGAKTKGESLTPQPLHAAVFGGNAEIVRLLLHHGADPDARSHGRTPLHVAARDGREQAVEVLLAGGASVKATTSGDSFVQIHWQPLHFAVAGGHRTIAARLLKAGALRPANDPLRQSLLALARQSGDEQMVQLLQDTK